MKILIDIKHFLESQGIKTFVAGYWASTWTSKNEGTQKPARKEHWSSLHSYTRLIHLSLFFPGWRAFKEQQQHSHSWTCFQLYMITLYQNFVKLFVQWSHDTILVSFLLSSVVIMDIVKRFLLFTANLVVERVPATINLILHNGFHKRNRKPIETFFSLLSRQKGIE